MHYPVMTEGPLADRWQISVKTLRRWRLNHEGPAWYKLFRHVRYHESDILEFERRSAQHLMGLLDINREFKVPKTDATHDQDPNATTVSNYLTANEVAEAATLPIYLLRDQAERDRRHVPYLMLVGNLRFSLPAILEWEIANSVPGHATSPVVEEDKISEASSARAKRWFEIVKEQDGVAQRSDA